jgi:hypothetical protein
MMCFVLCNLGPDEARQANAALQLSMVFETYRRKEKFITDKEKCRMTGIKLKG